MAADLIYPAYDQAALDRQYNNQLRVPGFADYVTGWQRESARGRASRCRASATSPSGRLRTRWSTSICRLKSGLRGAGAGCSIMAATGVPSRPDDFAFVAERLVEAGAIAVIVNYALVPSVRIGELVRQCRAALAGVHANIGR